LSAPGLPLLMTMVSVLALWALLTTLGLGLLLVVKPLESIRVHLERIAMGVRAIERETAPIADLGGRLPAATATLRDALEPLARKLRGFDATLARARTTARAPRRE